MIALSIVPIRCSLRLRILRQSLPALLSYEIRLRLCTLILI